MQVQLNFLGCYGSPSLPLGVHRCRVKGQRWGKLRRRGQSWLLWRGLRLQACVQTHLFPEADTGFRQSQASLIWRQLEEEEEGPREGSPRLLWRRQAQQNREEEDADIAGVSLQHPPRRRRRRRISEHPADDCGHFFVLGTLAAVFALLVNVLYPFLSTLELAGG